MITTTAESEVAINESKEGGIDVEEHVEASVHAETGEVDKEDRIMEREGEHQSEGVSGRVETRMEETVEDGAERMDSVDVERDHEYETGECDEVGLYEIESVSTSDTDDDLLCLPADVR
uniref:Uncharacterized protein n=1 Tax=Palpitomonas bilix TaxID=652834 RepID=A0A7S3LVC0_9EUKA